MSRVKGFTLLELLITLLILSVITSLAAPLLTTWIQRQRVSALQNSLTHSINFARSSAISLQQTLTLCPGTTQCENSWGDSVLIFADKNSNGLIDNREYAIKILELGSGGQSLDWKSFRRKSYLQFDATGQTKALNGSFHYCNEEENNAYNFKLTISKTGRLRVSTENICN